MSSPALRTGTDDGPEWYRDAVIYQLHVRSFCDSDGDGIGDFKGLISTLDYLHDLGVTAIWVLPFYPSPQRDDGYDIADYRSVNPAYGTHAGLRALHPEAHDRGLKVITELVLNHTSDQHPWFQRARRAPAGSRWRDFYVWSDDPRALSRGSDHLQGLRDLQLVVGSRSRSSTTGTASTRTSRISTSTTPRSAACSGQRSTSG